MDRLRDRAPARVKWVPPVIVLAAVVIDIWAPDYISGTAFYCLACVLAAAVSSFRYTMSVVLTCCAAVLVGYLAPDVFQLPPDEQVIRPASVLVAGLIGIDLNLAFSRTERRLGLVRTVAEELQRVVLPVPPVQVGPVHIACRYEAADTEAHIGGDLYAVQDTPYGMRMLIADVRGKGLPAVAVVSVLIGAFRERAGEEPELAGLAVRLDEALNREQSAEADPIPSEAFATALLVQVSPDHTSLQILNRGHPGPYLIEGSTVSELPTRETGLPLGMGALASQQVPPQPETVPFPPGCEVLCLTDGVTEARNGKGDFFDPLVNWRPEPQLSPEGLITSLVGAVTDWAGGTRHDDMALLVMAHDGTASDGTASEGAGAALSRPSSAPPRRGA
ncbi:PP2C family protein-serine/threonine phosphatase [Streptomyces sp. NPDC054796]